MDAVSRVEGVTMLVPIVDHSVSVPFSIDTALDAYTRKRTGPRANDLAYHPSGLFGCDRKVVYDVRDTPKPDTWKPGGNRPLLIGNVLGPVLQEAVQEQVGTTLLMAVSEPLIEIPELNVRGHADHFIRWSDGTPEVIENKTTNSNGLRMIKKAGKAKDEHWNQASTYTYGIREHGYWTGEGKSRVHHAAVPELERFRVVYWDKDRHGITPYEYTLTEEWIDSFREHIARLERYKADGEALPPRLPSGSWQCDYCDYQTKCWTQDREGTEL